MSRSAVVRLSAEAAVLLVLAVLQPVTTLPLLPVFFPAAAAVGAAELLRLGGIPAQRPRAVRLLPTARVRLRHGPVRAWSVTDGEVHQNPAAITNQHHR
ncbi:hypothetical protein QZH56_37030 (plasmid) [Streptomyces olivoreticuli]|uniref:hypothetical protein n=1 Tax=Streptomyces olivoreticuli TaxID=68246 RepID=UPI00265B50CA|nr:hypothetical protein [Streptomyces olivoreticuli]WKK27857.1 hypothetical protein QZH56_37030 [Streptomyces olivoreticuli]